VYPQQQQAAQAVYVERAAPALHEFDQYGQEVRRAPSASTPQSGSQQDASPVYLVAFQDGSIRAAVAYWVDGSTLHFVTAQHEERQAPLSSVDRELSRRLNQERRVTFSLPERH
jgi:hypothetical protein